MIRPGPLRLLELTLATPAENLALDEALLHSIEEAEGEPVLRLWESADYAVVLGRANKVERNVNLDACRTDGIPILRRCSGGGTVLIGPGSLFYSLVLRVETGDHLANISDTTAAVLERIASRLRRHIDLLEPRGTSDLAVGDAKVSGNAQRWLRGTLLHHGTLLYDFDLDRIERYLSPPEREPQYRRGRPHRQFVANLAIPRDQIRSSLIAGWDATLPPPVVPLDRVANLVQTRYSDAAWTLRP